MMTQWLYRILLVGGLTLMVAPHAFALGLFVFGAGLTLKGCYMVFAPKVRKMAAEAKGPDSLSHQTVMRAFTSGKPTIGSINEQGEMVFTELEWPEGYKIRAKD